MKDTKFFQTQVINPVLSAIYSFPTRNAFCINEVFYTYKQFGESFPKSEMSLKN